MGDQWELYNQDYIGGPMRWGTNEMGDQWDGGPLGLAENGWTNGKGDQWEGGPMSSNNVVGTYEMGTNEKGTNEMGDQWDGGAMSRGYQWDGGPMKWVVHGC